MMFQHFKKDCLETGAGQASRYQTDFPTQVCLAQNGQFVPNRIDDNQPAALK
jgi:hypothetical protein